jgi:phospholipid/cholesterol/gamma-HCH transport system ATP-binding protein
MQKRVALARALALDPDVLLFDEPTAGLDPITSHEIDLLILEQKQKRGMTSVVVTHDIHGVRTFADRVALLKARWWRKERWPCSIRTATRLWWIS